MFKNLLRLSIVLFCSVSYSQIGGQSVYQFLNLVTSPRQAALGGKVITHFDYDVNAGIFNPASINNEMDNHLSVNYGNYFGEITYVDKAVKGSPRIFVADYLQRDLEQFKTKYPNVLWENTENKTPKSGNTGEGTVDFRF